jgi:ferredoxin
MGSGGLVVMDEDTCMVDVAQATSSTSSTGKACGKCAPCREGLRKMRGILGRITEGKGEESDLDLLDELSALARETSLCALGRTAPNPVPQHLPVLPRGVRGAHPGQAVSRPLLQGARLVLDRPREVQGVSRLPQPLSRGGDRRGQEDDPRHPPGQVQRLRNVLRGLPEALRRGREAERRAGAAADPGGGAGRRADGGEVMSEITLRVDGREVLAKEGATLLDAARGRRHRDPHPLPPREAEALRRLPPLHRRGRRAEGWTQAPRLLRRTSPRTAPGRHGPALKRSTKPSARPCSSSCSPTRPTPRKLQELAVHVRRRPRTASSRSPTFCVHCGLCVRYCAEVKGLEHAVGFIDRGVRKEISLHALRSRPRSCDDCKECFPLCPTSYLQAAWVLVEGLAPRV